MNETEFLALLSPAGQDALYAAMGLQPREKDFLRLYQTLAKRYPRKLARAALETAILRGQAQSKFPQAQKMYFTREPLEQASVYEVAATKLNEQICVTVNNLNVYNHLVMTGDGNV